MFLKTILLLLIFIISNDFTFANDGNNKIENFPDHKKIMKKWISISAEKHKIFEKNVFTHDRHKLDLTNYYSEKVKPELEISDKSLNQIKQLNDLYKDGVLTKEEFDKAKSKILN